METLISKFGGKIGSDTEDFQPFMKVSGILVGKNVVFCTNILRKSAEK